METFTTVAQRLATEVRTAMDRAEISQREMAEWTGIPLATLQRRLSGATPLTVTELAALADILGVSIVELITTAELAAGASDAAHQDGAA